MSTLGKTFLALVAALVLLFGGNADARKRTVCTITVNSADEKDVFRKYLPASQFEFVELVERGRPDWLASACQQRVRCDVLIISGHFNGRTDFFSDRPDKREYLPVDEMERVSCSDSCSGLFAQVKEVYLFGCNTLNPEPVKVASPDVARSLVRSGHSPAEAQRIANMLALRHGESSRERMRRIFRKVPVLYGFASGAPVGPAAASRLDRYLRSASTEVGNGHVSQRFLGQFAGNRLAVARGATDADPGADYRQEVCQFFDDRLAPADKLRFVHRLLGREMAEVRMYFERIETLFASLSEIERQAPAFIQARDEIARDQAARERYLRFAEDADQPAIRARMIRVAGGLGWLSSGQQHAEITRMISELVARRSLGAGEVDLICSLNKEHEFDRELDRLPLSPAQASRVAPAAALACLGSEEGRARVMAALTSPDDEEVKIAQVYLAQRPLTDVGEFRQLASGIARMSASAAQARALETLAHLHLDDPETLESLAGLFPTARSLEVQRAIADLLIRSDYRIIAKPEMVHMLRQSRLKSPDGKDIIDVLIRRLQALQGNDYPARTG